MVQYREWTGKQGKSCGKDMQKMVWVRLRAEPLQQPSALSHLYSQVSYSDTHASKS